MGDDEPALIRLRREKRGEMQLGTVTEPLNRQWYEQNTGNAITDVQEAG
jgi:hypothetical protein